MVTIFTPTYNRCDKLEKLYKSLANQTDKDFKWLIIDDGSTDMTKEQVELWKEKINITYIYQSNSGKHIAINTAIKNCSTEFMLCVDSDDTLAYDAVYTINKVLLNYFENNIWAVVGPRVKKENMVNSKWIVNNNRLCKFVDLYCKFGYVGDTYIIMNVDYLRDFSFPKFGNEKLVPENILYDALDKNYFIKTSNYSIYLSEYYQDGYTINNNKILFNSPKGTALSNISSASNKYNSIYKKVLSYSRYLAIKKVFHIETEDLFENYKVNVIVKLFSSMLFPIMYIHYWKKRK